MSRRRFSTAAVFCALLLLVGSYTHANMFVPGDLAVFQADSATANNTTFTILELSPTTPAANPVQSIGINGTTGPSALRTSGSATSTGYLADTNDGTLLAFDAHNSTSTSGNANTMLARGVGTLNNAGTFALQTTYTGTSGNQARGATSVNNTNWYIGDQGGIYTNGTTTASPAANVRAVKPFGGLVYTLQQSSSAASIVVNTVSAPSGGTITGLPGLANDNTAVDFYMISSGHNGLGVFDVLYVSTTAGINKFSFDGSTWAAKGSTAVAGGLFGIAAAIDPLGGADLFVTTGGGASAANKVLKFLDSAAWNANISVGSSTTLYTASATTTLKGIAFAPVPEASAFLLGGLICGVFGLKYGVRTLRRKTGAA